MKKMIMTKAKEQKQEVHQSSSKEDDQEKVKGG
jgi:hypothetical protein